MRVRIPARARPHEFARTARSRFDPSGADTSGHPDVEDILGEIGLILVVILGTVLAINAVLISLHIAP